MTTAEAAAELGLSPITIRAAIRRGHLPAAKVGRDWWVQTADLIAYRALHRGRVGRPYGSTASRPAETPEFAPTLPAERDLASLTLEELQALAEQGRKQV